MKEDVASCDTDSDAIYGFQKGSLCKTGKSRGSGNYLSGCRGISTLSVIPQMRFIKANAQLRLRQEDSPEVYRVIYDQCGGFVECDANARGYLGSLP